MQLWPSGGLWRHPDFLRLWGAQIASAFGSRISRTALPIIAILTIDATPIEVAILSALSVAPGVFVGLFVGGYIDRHAKRPLLVGADLLRAGLILTIPAAAWFGALSMPQLYVVAAAVGAASALFQIADNTFLPVLIGKDRLIDGNAKLEATDSIAEATGPGAAGVLIQLLTAPIAMIVDAVTYLWSALLLSRIRAHERLEAVDASDSHVLKDISIGLRACLSHRLVSSVLFANSVMYFFGGFFLALYMLFALRNLGFTAAGVGLIISVGGVGAFVGAMIAQPLGRIAGVGGALAISMLVGQGANALVPLAAHFPQFATALLIGQQLIGDAFLSAYVIHSVSLRQRELPEGVLGRANASFHVVTGLMLPAGALIAGPLGNAVGVSNALWIGVCGGLLAAPVLLTTLLVGSKRSRQYEPP
ncbi:MAG: MFS transporter [Steroidobacter sp.]